MATAAARFMLAPLPGKGMAVIATAPIPAGTLLFTESPLMLLSPLDHQSGQSADSASATPATATTTVTPHEARVLARFWRCDASQRQAILALCSNLSSLGEGGAPTADAVALGVWKANNFCLDGAGTVNGVFELASRLNHACVGGDNCRWEWDGGPGTVAFWTVRDVVVREPRCAEEKAYVTNGLGDWGRTAGGGADALLPSRLAHGHAQPAPGAARRVWLLVRLQHVQESRRLTCNLWYCCDWDFFFFFFLFLFFLFSLSFFSLCNGAIQGSCNCDITAPTHCDCSLPRSAALHAAILHTTATAAQWGRRRQCSTSRRSR